MTLLDEELSDEAKYSDDAEYSVDEELLETSDVSLEVCPNVYGIEVSERFEELVDDELRPSISATVEGVVERASEETATDSSDWDELLRVAGDGDVEETCDALLD